MSVHQSPELVDDVGPEFGIVPEPVVDIKQLCRLGRVGVCEDVDQKLVDGIDTRRGRRFQCLPTPDTQIFLARCLSATPLADPRCEVVVVFSLDLAAVQPGEFAASSANTAA